MPGLEGRATRRVRVADRIPPGRLARSVSGSLPRRAEKGTRTGVRSSNRPPRAGGKARVKRHWPAGRGAACQSGRHEDLVNPAGRRRTARAAAPVLAARHRCHGDGSTSAGATQARRPRPVADGHRGSCQRRGRPWLGPDRLSADYALTPLVA